MLVDAPFKGQSKLKNRIFKKLVFFSSNYSSPFTTFLEEYSSNAVLVLLDHFCTLIQYLRIYCVLETIV